VLKTSKAEQQIHKAYNILITLQSSCREHVDVQTNQSVALLCASKALSKTLEEPLPLAFALAISNSTESPRQQVVLKQS